MVKLGLCLGVCVFVCASAVMAADAPAAVSTDAGADAASGGGADVNLGLDYGTSYIFRGEALNNRSVLQPYMEVTPKEFPVTLGVWGNYNAESDTSGTPKHSEFSEVDFYLSYELPLNIDWLTTSVGYNEYTYPNGDVDDDREFAIKGAVNGFFLTPSLGIYPGVGGAYAGQLYMEGALSHEEELYEKLTAAMDVTTGVILQGHRNSELSNGFDFAKVGLQLSYKFVKATVNYYFQTNEDVLEVKQHWQGLVGVSYQF